MPRHLGGVFCFTGTLRRQLCDAPFLFCFDAIEKFTYGRFDNLVARRLNPLRCAESVQSLKHVGLKPKRRLQWLLSVTQWFRVCHGFSRGFRCESYTEITHGVTCGQTVERAHGSASARTGKSVSGRE